MNRILNLRSLTAIAIFVVLAVPTRVGAVVGGNNVEPGEYPFFVRIERTNAQNRTIGCGATLIDPEWVLTAAHCVDDLTTIQITARFGEFSQPRTSLSRTPIREVRIHPRWTGDALDGYDEALLRIDRNAIPAPVVAVGGPGASGSWAAGRPATIIGYGQTSASNTTTPTIMREVDTVIRSDDYMDDLYGVAWGAYDWWFAGGMIGAGGFSGTACYGDSGGPLLVKAGSTWLQVGITSFTDETFGDQCNQAAAFTEMVDGGELAWIAHHVPSVTSTWGTCTVTRNGFNLGTGPLAAHTQRRRHRPSHVRLHHRHAAAPRTHAEPTGVRRPSMAMP